ncbi:MAG: caspase family protein [Pseudomonadota bacterium]
MTRRVLLIGVGGYAPESGLTALQHAGNDVALLQELLVDPQFGGDPGMVTVLHDVTRGEAERAIFRFLKDLERDDIALIHFSGHGVQDASGGLYLCFTDTQLSALEITALPIETLRRLIDNQRARRVLITLDCCYSGIAGDQLTRGDMSSVSRNLQGVEEDFGHGQGVYVLSAAGRTQTAKEDAEVKAGVFTWHIAEGIRTGQADLDSDGRITVSELAGYLQREVPKDAARQTPHLSARNVTGSFVVAENRLMRLGEKVTAFRALVRRLAMERNIGLSFAGDVDEWLETSDVLTMPETRQWELLEAMEAGKVVAADFQERWRGLNRSAPLQSQQPLEPDAPAASEPEHSEMPDRTVAPSKGETRRWIGIAGLLGLICAVAFTYFLWPAQPTKLPQKTEYTKILASARSGLKAMIDNKAPNIDKRLDAIVLIKSMVDRKPPDHIRRDAIDILTSYIRNNVDERRGPGEQVEFNEKIPEKHYRPADIVKALEALQLLRSAGSPLEVNLGSIDFSKMGLYALDFEGFYFGHANFTDAALSDCKCLSADFRHAIFHNTATWGTRKPAVANFRKTRFERADLRASKWANVDFTGSNIEKSVGHEGVAYFKDIKGLSEQQWTYFSRWRP